MFHKTGSRIKQFISPKRNETVRDKDQWPQNYAKQKRQLMLKSWMSQDRKSTDEAFMRRTNGNTAVQASSPPLPSPLPTQYSLRSFCECDCNSPIRSPPHSLSKFDTCFGTSKDLCLGLDESPRLTSVSQSNPVITFLPSNKSVNNLYQTTSTSQIDLLEALALEPKADGDETTHEESLTIYNPNSDDASKAIQRLICETNHTFKASEFVLTNAPTTSQELHPNKHSLNVITRKMSPRIEPRRQYRAPVPPKVILTQPESALPQEREEHRVSGYNSIDKASDPTDSPQTLGEMRKHLSVVSSREYFKQIIMNRRAGSEGIDHLGVESLGENNLRPSSETSCSTASGSTGSTPLEPFHLEDLPLRIRLAEGLHPERPEMQCIEIRRSTASTITLQNTVPVRSFNPSPFNIKIRKAQYACISESEVVLKSTNFSLTTSRFKHGDIRLGWRPRPATKSVTSSTARSSLAISHNAGDLGESSNRQAKDRNRAANDELDLTGFQMAISGATSHHWMGECENCLADGPHPRLEDLEVKVDELMKWCDDFGLDMGRLIKSHLPEEKELEEEVLRRRKGRQVSSEAIAEDFLNAVGLLEASRQLRIGAEGNHEDLVASAPPYEAIKMEGETRSKSRRYEKGGGTHDGEASLPPSPMQSIGPGALARPETFVPMGFNVDHDLRDYLKWKSECVKGTAEGDI